MRILRMKKRWLLWVAAIALYLLAIGSIYSSSYDEDAHKADCAIVFGNKVHVDGTPSARLAARLDASFLLYQSGRIKRILVSGAVGKEGHDESAVMAKYLIQKGVGEKNILIDNEGYTTSKTSMRSVQLLGPHTEVIAVTQQYHISRAKLSLRNAGFNNVQGYYPSFFELRDLYSSVREVLAWIKYWIKDA